MILHKYCASGNDFLIYHHFIKTDRAHLARQLCCRHHGFGADGLVVLLPHPVYAYEWNFYNADGSEASMCGNASRCVAFYAYEQGLAPLKHSFLSASKAIEVEIQELQEERALVESNLGRYTWLESFELGKATWHLIDTGVPHLVHFVQDMSLIPTQRNSTLQALRSQFDANVNIACIQDRQTIALATYERGVEDITLACGTGMAAVFIAAHAKHSTDKQATLIPPSGEHLRLCLQKDQIYFKGWVRSVGSLLYRNSYKNLL